MSLCCQQDDRRDTVRAAQGLNGLDYVEVSDDQLTLYRVLSRQATAGVEVTEETRAVDRIFFSSSRAAAGSRRFESGTSMPVADPDPEKDDQLVVRLDKYGDFSTYTLGLVGVSNIDPRYQQVDFNFKSQLPVRSRLRARLPMRAGTARRAGDQLPGQGLREFSPTHSRPPGRAGSGLDGTPRSRSRHRARRAARLHRRLPELLQDAVATEAYLETARQRISVRRHARLVDYKLHEGCNARAWVCIETDSDFNLTIRPTSRSPPDSTRPFAGKSILTWYDLRNVPANRLRSVRRHAVGERGAAPVLRRAQRDPLLHLGRKGVLSRAGALVTLGPRW